MRVQCSSFPLGLAEITHRWPVPSRGRVAGRSSVGGSSAAEALCGVDLTDGLGTGWVRWCGPGRGSNSLAGSRWKVPCKP